VDCHESHRSTLWPEHLHAPPVCRQAPGCSPATLLLSCSPSHLWGCTSCPHWPASDCSSLQLPTRLFLSLPHRQASRLAFTLDPLPTSHRGPDACDLKVPQSSIFGPLLNPQSALLFLTPQSSIPILRPQLAIINPHSSILSVCHQSGYLLLSSAPHCIAVRLQAAVQTFSPLQVPLNL